MLDPPAIRSSGTSHVIAVWRGHVLARWDGQPSVRTAQEFEAILIERVTAQPGRTACLTVLPSSLELPSAEVRAAFARAGESVDGRLTCTAVAVEGDGFHAAALHAMATGISMMAHARFPLRSFASINEAARWAAATLERAGGHLGTPADVVEAFTLLLRTHLR